MPWLRLGDNAATYPKLMQIAGYPGADDRAVREVFGWLVSCATQSAGHMTDYRVDAGTAGLFGGSRTKLLTRWCVRAGLLKPVKVDGVQQWSIIEDPEFIHIRTRAEVEWDRQRQRDVADVGLIVPVRLRDGDNCRYCGVLVQWRGKKSNRSAEYDHRHPGEPATVDTLVVACRRCNGSRQANPQWDDDHPLRPVPTHPNYSTWTATFLTENGYPTEPTVEPGATTHRSSTDTAAAHTAARPTAARTVTPRRHDGPAPDDTAAAPSSASATVTDQPGPAGDTTPGAAPDVGSELAPNSHRGSLGTGSPGSGRDQGRGGSGGSRRGGRGRRRPQGGAPPTDAPPDAPCCSAPYPATDESGTTICLTCERETP